MNNTNKITLYVDLMSQPSRSVYWFILLNDIPHTLELIQLMKGEHRSRAYLQKYDFPTLCNSRNPLGTVPLIQDGDFYLGESATIVRYLSNTRRVEDQWYPSLPRDRAKVDFYLDWCVC